MFKIGDKVRVKLREPVGSPTTQTANDYLRTYEGLKGNVYQVKTIPSFEGLPPVVWVKVYFEEKGTASFYPHELEVVNATD